jgi:hypothetical protein
MEAGTSTGWLVAVRSAGWSGWPGGSARVAPLRWTHSRRCCPSSWWVSGLARLWETS